MTGSAEPEFKNQRYWLLLIQRRYIPLSPRSREDPGFLARLVQMAHGGCSSVG